MPKEALLGIILGSNNTKSLPQANPRCLERLQAIDMGITSPIKKTQRPRDPKRDTSVSFEEMKVNSDSVLNLQVQTIFYAWL